MSIRLPPPGSALPVPPLVRAAQGGDRDAFAQLYARYAGMVYAIALASGPMDEVDDIVQEVFLRALRDLKALRDVEAFGAWLASIARNTLFNARRRARPAQESEEEVGVGDTQFQEMEARRALHTIRSLPKAYRETLLMRLVQGMTGPEIADRTGLTPASVRVNLYRGMRLLRERLERGTKGTPT